MRSLVQWLWVVVGLAVATGCGGSHPEVRTSSSVPIEPPQAQLDGIAAHFLNGLIGGVH